MDAFEQLAVKARDGDASACLVLMECTKLNAIASEQMGMMDAAEGH